MSHPDAIREILIDRDIAAFVARDWEQTRIDFDERGFTGLSGEGGTVSITFPSLDDYRDSWLTQAAEFADADPAAVAEQLHDVQRIDELHIAGSRAVARKVFDGSIELDGRDPRRLEWTTYYFLRLDRSSSRWLITGFLGYLPRGAQIA